MGGGRRGEGGRGRGRGKGEGQLLYSRHFALTINAVCRSVSEKSAVYCLLCVPHNYQISRCFNSITTILAPQL